MTKIVTIEAKPLLRETFTPFGTVIDASRNPMFCEDGQYFVERLTLTRRTGPMRHINRHFDSTQLFIPVTQTPFLIVVAPAYLSAGTFDPPKIQAFVAQPDQAFTFAIGTWHIGPRSLDGRPMTFVNLQGQRSNEEHTEDIDLVELLDTAVKFRGLGVAAE